MAYIRTKYLNSSINAFYSSLNSYNQIWSEYRNEESLILMANAIELISKSILLKLGKSINTKIKGETISCERAVLRLNNEKQITEIEHQTLQQVISLRNAAIHSFLPAVSNEIMQHLMFGTFKTFRNLIEKHFPNHKNIFTKNFMSISLDENLTYADSVEPLLKKFSKIGSHNRQLIWLLERGVSFDGGKYISQEKFEKDFLKSKKRVLNRVNLGKYLSKSEQVKLVLIQAPKGYTADFHLRKGSKKTKEALPVMIKKTDISIDYPYLTGDLAKKLNKNISFTSKTVRSLNLYGDDKYHQSVHNKMQCYSDAALSYLKKHLTDHPNYSPYK